MSSGGQTSSVTSQPPAWYSNAAQSYLNRAGEVAGQDYVPYTGQRVADMSPITRGSIQGLWGLANGHPMGDDAVNMTRQTLQGGYSNPFGGVQGGANVSTQRNQFAGEQTPGVGTQRNQYAGMDNPHLRTIMDQGQEDITKNYFGAVNNIMSRFKDRNSSSFQAAQSNAQDNLARQLGQYNAGMMNEQLNRSSGLEESFLGRDFAGQQFNANLGENAINRRMGAEESFLGRDFAGQQFNSGLGERAVDRGFQGHENERNRQMQGVGAATGLLGSHRDSLMAALQGGGLEQQHMQDLLNSNYGDFREWRDYDKGQSDFFGNSLSRAAGGAGSTQTSQGPGPDRMSQGMGALAMANYLGRGK